MAACFPPPLTCEEIAAKGLAVDHCALDAADSGSLTDTGGVDATGLDVTDSETADSPSSDAASDTDADDTSEVTAEVTSETADTDSSGEVIETNACGGVGTVGPGQPGDPCGPCLDGVWACDPGDEEGRTTRCEDASAVDACGGCGLAHPLGDTCGDCGTYRCATDGSTAVVCREPDGGCPVILTCADLGCDGVSRECIESDGVDDARCGDCLATHVLVAGACVPRIVAPTDLTATIDRAADVALSWTAAAHATGYRVYRCDVADCSSDATWDELTTTPIVERTYVDATAAAPGAPSAPATVDATRTRTDRVDVTWSAVSAPLAATYRYRVTTIGAAGESAPSSVATGHRAERPVTGYELQIDGGAWAAVSGGLVTSWSDTGALAPTLDAGTATASVGTFQGYVRVSVTGSAATAGATRTYRVRAITADGPAPMSSAVDGWRLAGALGYQWERSAGTTPASFSALVGATGPSHDDTTAPTDASVRWYRVVVSATGAAPVTSDPVAGARQAPLNACGGIGTVGPGVPGDPCGPCLDGAWACDPNDAEGRTTRCEDASAVDACGGCGLAHPLGDACGDCGTYGCATDGSTAVVCLEPDEGCPIILTCADLDCDAVSRECIESDGVADALCGDCLATHVLVGGACVPRIVAPTGVTASADRSADVEVTWAAAAHATGYRVYRCDVTDCSPDAAWNELTTTPIAERTYLDAATVAPGAPSAPATVDATRTRTDRVDVTWSAVVAPLAPTYRYRVTTIGAAGESAPSSVATGHRAERPVTGYEIQVDGGAWAAVSGGLVTSWSDTGALPATLAAGTASASLGTFPSYVRASVTGSAASAGATRSYRVRAITAYGPAPMSAAVDGWRVAGALGYQWERSPGTDPVGFTTLAGATTASYDDTTAPADGSTRWYRVIVSASGAASVTSSAVAGSRQGPPGVPSGVRASRDLTDRVNVEWQPVSGAIGYHIYRDGVKLTTVAVTASPYADLTAPAPTTSWAAPTSVSATTNNTTQVTVQWTAPVQPLGADGSYQVSAVNPAGEGALSTATTGRRVALALVGYEVEVTPSGGGASWSSTGSTTTSWIHTGAPAPSITPGSVTATQGAHLAHTRLGATGAVANPGTNVSYRVRGILQGGATYTPTSTSAVGRRSVGTLTLQWQRSASTSAADFTNLTGATASSVNDATAPSDGSSRWYRLTLSATGVSSTTVGPVEGWRLAFFEVGIESSKSCAISTRGVLWCWGDSAAPAAVSLPSELTGLAEVALGREHTCVRTGAGQVWCWGSNTQGQLGDGTNTTRTTPAQVVLGGAAVGLSAGPYGNCVALATGRVQCWGAGWDGELGNNTTSSSNVPVTVLTSATTELTGALGVAVGAAHACARTATGARCWGNNFGGQLGDGTITSRSLAVQVSGLAAPQELAAGGLHTCARLSNVVRCWGYNANGQLGNSSTTQSNVPVSVVNLFTTSAIVAGDNASAAVDASGLVYQWGEGASSVPSEVVGLAGATAIASHSHAAHTCAVLAYAVKCWGANGSKQLGDGTTTSRSTPVNVLFP